jgi:hypothetical protein
MIKLQNLLKTKCVDNLSFHDVFFFICFYDIPRVEWILVHRYFTCKSKNSRILAPLIILEQSLKYKSCRVLKMVPNSYLFCFLTSSGSTQ